jgi:hypothetical protein
MRPVAIYASQKTAGLDTAGRVSLLIRRRRRRRDGPMLGAQERDDLRYFLIAERVRKRGHLLSAIQNLIFDLGWGPQLVLTNFDERGGFLGPFSAGAVAVGTTFVAKQNCPGHLIGLRVGGKCRLNEHTSKNEGSEKRKSEIHLEYFRMAKGRMPPLFE